MKLPKYLMDRMENSSDVSDPKTAEDFYDLGVSEEESGDRWFTSDLGKGLRFYNRAHDYYLKSLEIDPTFSDALFNLPRLEFDVYIKYIKDDSVVMSDLENCDEVLKNKSNFPLIKDLTSICKTFESCFEIGLRSNSTIGWDFYYNLALVYFEYIETLCSDIPNVDAIFNPNNEIVLSLERCVNWFDQIFNYFESFNGEENEFFGIDSIVQVICDAYNLISTVNESMYSNQLLDITNPIMEPLLNKIDKLANELLINGMVHVSSGIELRLAKLNQRSSSLYDFQSLIQCWNSQNETLGNCVEKKLLEGSSYRTFLDKLELSLSDEAKWGILTHMSAFYKELYEITRNEVTELEKSRDSYGDTLSSKICLLCSINTERADIELERSLLDVEISIQNRPRLETNAKNILKNTIIFSKKSGGLKESVGGKLSRSKKQREAVMRLCLIDGNSQEEWDVILGARYWPVEIQTLNDISIYKNMCNYFLKK